MPPALVPPTSAGGASAVASPQVHTIIFQANTFDPSLLTINVGDTVEWIKKRGIGVVNFNGFNNPESFASPFYASDYEEVFYTHTFTIAGEYSYDNPYALSDVARITVNES